MRRIMLVPLSMRSCMKRIGSAGARGFPKGTRRTGQTARSARTQEQNRPAVLKWLAWFIVGIMVLNVLGGLMDAFLYW